MKSILIDVKKNNTAEIVDIDFDLETYYNLIGCDIIDIVSRVIGGNDVCIIIDDEGLLKHDPIVSAVSYNRLISGNDLIPELVGNLIITGPVDDDGNLTGLSNQVADFIMNRYIMVVGPKNNVTLLID